MTTALPLRAPRWLLLAPFLLCILVTPPAPGGLEPPPVKGYETRLRLDEPIHAGPAQTVTGSGAPSGSGIWVELWRLPARGGRAESLGSVAAVNGRFTFREVDVLAGEAIYVTLSRSWHFRTPGDLEGWDGSTNDALLRVEHGVLAIELQNLDGDPYMDPWIQAFFPFDPRYYRVVEVRLLNPAVLPSRLSVFWGSPWATRISEHLAEIPSAMADFQTMQIPMNVDEIRITPPPLQEGLDGLWDRGALNDSLRIDPLQNVVGPNDRSLDGLVFFIDTIRIREDYRHEFHHSGDAEGILVTHDIAEFAASGGFLRYTASAGGMPGPGGGGAADPYFLSGLATGRLDTDYFTRVALGLENEGVAVDPLVLGVLFDDEDGTGYRDDGGAGPLQRGELSLPPLGRRDEVRSMDAASGGEWTEDGGRIPASTLRLDCPEGAREGDRIGIDYFGWIPESPYGPSEPVVVRSEPAEELPEVELGVTGGCGEQVEGEPFSPFSAAFDCTLTTSANPLGEGARGWSLSLGSEGVVVAGVTAQGTAAASVHDDPPGLVEDDGFALFEVTSGPGNEGFVSVVVLSFEMLTMLPPTGSERVAQIAVEGSFPAAGGCQDARLFYVDGRRGSGLPVENGVSFLGETVETVKPALGGCAFTLCALGPSALQLPMDCNQDRQTNLSDAVCILGFLFRGRPSALPCADGSRSHPANLRLVDCDGNGQVELTDAVCLLRWLFLGRRPPANCVDPGCVACIDIAGCEDLCSR